VCIIECLHSWNNRPVHPSWVVAKCLDPGHKKHAPIIEQSTLLGKKCILPTCKKRTELITESPKGPKRWSQQPSPLLGH